MFVFLVISVILSIAVGMITLNWFFRDGEDSTRSFQEFYDRSFGPLSFLPWWMTKFGIWLGVSIGSVLLCYQMLPLAWEKLLSIL